MGEPLTVERLLATIVRVDRLSPDMAIRKVESMAGLGYGVRSAGVLCLSPELYDDFMEALDRGEQTFLAWLEDKQFIDLDKFCEIKSEK